MASGEAWGGGDMTIQTHRLPLSSGAAARRRHAARKGQNAEAVLSGNPSSAIVA
jgi:hypothetical protein